MLTLPRSETLYQCNGNFLRVKTSDLRLSRLIITLLSSIVFNISRDLCLVAAEEFPGAHLPIGAESSHAKLTGLILSPMRVADYENVCSHCQ